MTLKSIELDYESVATPNEIVEFLATTLGPTNVGGYVNTSYDLIANAAGALIAVAVIRFVKAR